MPGQREYVVCLRELRNWGKMPAFIGGNKTLNILCIQCSSLCGSVLVLLAVVYTRHGLERSPVVPVESIFRGVVKTLICCALLIRLTFVALRATLYITVFLENCLLIKGILNFSGFYSVLLRGKSRPIFHI